MTSSRVIGPIIDDRWIAGTSRPARSIATELHLVIRETRGHVVRGNAGKDVGN